jgi:hypothetical protein
MLVSQDLLFLHVPKTAGTSMMRYLADVLPKPIWWYGATPKDVERAGAGVTAMPWPGQHLSLEGAGLLVRHLGLEIHEFPIILTTIRNPYEWEVSHYAY